MHQEILQLRNFNVNGRSKVNEYFIRANYVTEILTFYLSPLLLHYEYEISEAQKCVKCCQIN